MLRADSHDYTHEVLRFCRAKGLDYTLLGGAHVDAT
jgi:hypothetical protein